MQLFVSAVSVGEVQAVRGPVFGPGSTLFRRPPQRTFLTDAGNAEPKMSIHVDANFCIRHLASVDSNYNLLLRMQRLGFVFTGMNSYIQAEDTNCLIEANELRVLTEELAREVAEKMVHPGHVDIDFLRRADGQTHEARLIPFMWPDKRFWMCSFCVDEAAFFPTSRDLTFESTESEVFQSFRSGIIEVERHLEPTIAFVDYEEEYSCAGPKVDRDVVLRRGNYLPRSILNRWSPGDVATLLDEADIATEIAERGLQFFFFPSLYPYGWTDRYSHRLMRIREFYDRNSVWSMFGSDA